MSDDTVSRGEAARALPDPPTAERPAAPEAAGIFFRHASELELLISAGVLFALLQLPGYIEATYLELRLHVDDARHWPVFFAYYYLTLITYALTMCFFINLAVRIYWVGLLGLVSVFPEGIRWRRLTQGPISQKVLRGLPPLESLIRGADRIASLTFSFSFLLVLIFVFSIFVGALAAAIAWLIAGGFGDKRRFRNAIFLALGILLAPLMLANLVDKLLAKRFAGDWKDNRLARFLYRLMTAYQYAFMGPLYVPIQLTLLTNVRKSVAYGTGAVGFAGILALFVLSALSFKSDGVLLHSYRYFPEDASAERVDYRHYRSLHREDGVRRAWPSIQSDVIADPFVKLFVPYSPRRDNAALAERCGELAAPAEEKGDGERARAAVGRAAIGCLAGLYEVTLNGAALEPDYDLYVDPETGVRGLVAYFPTADLPRGRNLLRIARTFEDEDDDEPPADRFIPFWI